MVRNYYLKYNCQICGKRTKSNTSMAREGLKVPTCLVCHRTMCYKCKNGGFCKTCIDLIPEDIRIPYQKKAKILKIFHYSYMFISYLFCLLFFGTFIILMIAPEYEEIAMYSLYTSFILMGFLICPGLIIYYIVKSIESELSNNGAMKLLNQMSVLTGNDSTVKNVGVENTGFLFLDRLEGWCA